MRLHLLFGLFAATLFVSVPPVLPIFAQATVQDSSEIVELFTVRDRLDESDNRLEDGSYYQSHTFEGTAGQSVIIEIVSEEFDTYLLLLDPTGDTIAENDDSSGTNSRIVIELPTTGRYTILANSYAAGATGDYVLTLREGNLLAYFQQQLEMHRQAGDQQAELEMLQAIAEVHTELQQYDWALEIYQEALGVAEGIDNRLTYANIVYEIGDVYYDLEEYDRAIEAYQQSIEIYRNLEDVPEEVRLLSEANALSGINLAYGQKGQLLLRLEYLQRELAIYRELGRQVSVVVALNGIGQLLGNLGRYEEGVAAFQEAISISQELDRKDLELFVLRGLGQVNRFHGQYIEALEALERALEIVQSVEPSSLVITVSGTSSGVSISEAIILSEIATVYEKQGNFTQAIDFYQQALSIAEVEENWEEQEVILNNIGIVYIQIGEYQQAFQAFQTSLELVQMRSEVTNEPFAELSALFSRATTLDNLGTLYSTLGDDDQALNYYQQALAIRQDLRSTAHESSIKEAITLGNIGLVYGKRGQYSEALDFLQRALEVAQELNAIDEQITILANIGDIYENQKRYNTALETYEQALSLARQIGARESEGHILNNIGFTYRRLESYSQAIEYYGQSLTISRGIGDQEAQARTLSNLGYLLDAKNQPEVAIVFLKESVNIYESLRGRIRTLEQGLQSSYAESVSHTYRTLADLLLEQGRILEAEQVLELLKVREIREYTRGAVVNPETGEIRLSPAETEILAAHESLIAFASTYAECTRTVECSDEIIEQYQQLNREWYAAVDSFAERVAQRRGEDGETVSVDNLPSVGKDIVEAQPGTVLIYPLVLKDKLWILWITEGGVANPIEVPVTERELADAVLEFRQLMRGCEVRRCNSDADIQAIQAVSQRLYRWLIPPQLEAEFEQNEIQNLVFALDRAIRYIPMAALFDGENYLIENYTVSNITAAGLTNRDNPLPPGAETSVLALGLSESVPANPASGIPGFGSLPYVPQELSAIVRSTEAEAGIYQGLNLLNDDFHQNSLRQAPNHQILHIATHGLFDPVVLNSSFLVLGTKEPLRITDIERELGSTVFSNLSLVVLSACETALGEPEQYIDGSVPDGREISGIAQAFIDLGVDTVVASLWQVNDFATSELMQQFYGALAQGTAESPVTISQSLRQAQLGLLYGDTDTANENHQGETRALEVRVIPGQQSASGGEADSSHPYYWAPFILIGNGL